MREHEKLKDAAEDAKDAVSRHRGEGGGGVSEEESEVGGGP